MSKKVSDIVIFGTFSCIKLTTYKHHFFKGELLDKNFSGCDNIDLYFPINKVEDYLERIYKKRDILDYIEDIYYIEKLDIETKTKYFILETYNTDFTYVGGIAFKIEPFNFDFKQIHENIVNKSIQKKIDKLKQQIHQLELKL